MLLNKKRTKQDDLELEHLMAVREAWKKAKLGIQVCLVTVYECDWNTLLGDYYKVMIKYVDQGLIYHRVEDTVKPELQIQVDDLDKVIIEMGMV